MCPSSSFASNAAGSPTLSRSIFTILQVFYKSNICKPLLCMQFFPNSMKHFVYKLPFTLESGEVLNGLTIAYHSFGQMTAHKDNIVWVCHHLTANTDVMAWWGGMMGPGCAIDPAKHFVICANVLGSCYGTTGPLNINPSTGRPYYSRFPAFTIRDMVKAHILLREHLGIPAIHLLIG